MSKKDSELNQLVAFAQYVSWCDVLRRTHSDALAKTGDPDAWDHVTASRAYGLLCYFYASVYVVVEAWREMRFSDPIIDPLLATHGDLVNDLRRFRNGVFHFQRDVTDQKFMDLLARDNHVEWVTALHEEFVRFLWEHLQTFAQNADDMAAIRRIFLGLIDWFPADDLDETVERIATLAKETVGVTDPKAAERLTTSVRALRVTLQEMRWENLRKLGVPGTVRPNST